MTHDHPVDACQGIEKLTVKRYVLGFCFGPSLTTVVLIKKNRPAWQAGRLNGVGGAH